MTIKHGCPGQDFRNLTAQIHKCPACKTDVEIFSSENRVRCHNCGSMVHKDCIPSCVDWCASAQECMGEERWKLSGR